jgi:chitinase
LTVTAYFAGDTAQLARYDPRKVTHIIFSFCHLKGNRLFVDNWADTVRIQRLVALKKQNSNLKVLLSLGGWGGCPSCSDVFSTRQGRDEFAASVKAVNDFFGTDGIDLDWEYPAIEGHPGHKYVPADKQNFTALVVALRNRLGKRNEISFAAGGFQQFIDEAIEWEKVMPLVDRVNLMSYDLVNGYATTTGHHTPLFSTPQQKESADAAITRLLRKRVPARKIVIGAAFYARVWEDVAQTDTGLYQGGKFKEAVGYRDFDTRFPRADGFASYWDPVAKAPFLYSSSKKLFVTYDDKRSLTEKVRYAGAKGLNGIMFWEWSHDLPANGLLDAINAARIAK